MKLAKEMSNKILQNKNGENEIILLRDLLKNNLNKEIYVHELEGSVLQIFNSSSN